KERFLRGRVAGNQPARSVELRESGRVEMTERHIRRGHQPAIPQAHADVAGAPEREAAREQRSPQPADFIAQIRFAQSRHAIALRKKSSAPKFPDLSASASLGSAGVAVQGTPGSICGPIRSSVTPSALTTAP